MPQGEHPQPQTYQIHGNLLPFLFYTIFVHGGEGAPRLSWK